MSTFSTAADLRREKGIRDYVIYFTTVTSLIFMFLLFPVYRHVTRANRQKDEETAVYPILRHFYFMVKVFYAIFVQMVVSFTIFAFFHFWDFNGNMTLFPIYLIAFCAVLLNLVIANIVAQVHIVLMAILACQRFLLYFFEASEPFVNLPIKTMKRVIRFIYTILIVRHTLETLYYSRVKSVDYLPELIFYTCLNVFLIFSFSLYIPILISIRKQSHLQSAVQNKPERYIIYHTLSILVIKVVVSPIAILNADSIENFLFMSAFSDLITCPLIIQVSYILGNRKNFDSSMTYVLKTIKKKVLFWRKENVARIRPGV